LWASAIIGSGSIRTVTDEVRDVATGLWIWRLEHPGWHPEAGWEPAVTSTCVE
jgi:hypothetical protein